MYVGNKFGKQVVTKAVPLFNFDVVNKALSFERVFVDRGGIYVFAFEPKPLCSSILQKSGFDKSGRILSFWMLYCGTGLGR